ncbi:biotin-independent malonate decarboxylase subunit beta [Granulicella cerasi]|uniref:Biotin-independent malonate decarboxylase subunit beta n=1 Tax=Granulicella cerasi TaxID=741063 RepID=A0ABW1Z7W9_9BACT|nr:biotin-independent malonate decarboxylase subunit beta [Granulicella cerasi]
MSGSFSNSAEFLELSARERTAALLDKGRPRVELLGPFDRIASPWLKLSGRVAQADDGVVVTRGFIAGMQAVVIAIEASFEGGSIGEVGGAKIATALQLAAGASLAGQTMPAVLLLETGGVRLNEANLGLAAIADIQRAILDLREHAPVVAVIAGPVGCFGGMSLAAALCTHIIGTRYARYGMNGPEVIEQEAGAAELNADDRELVWSIYGCSTRAAAGWIDALVPANTEALRDAVAASLKGELVQATRPSPAEQLASWRSNWEGADADHR